MKNHKIYIFHFLLFLSFLHSLHGWKGKVRAATAAALLSFLPIHDVLLSAPLPAVAVQDGSDSGVSLQAQLQELRMSSIGLQKALLEKQDENLIAQELLYPEGKLVGRGAVYLDADERNRLLYPYGFQKASDIDALYDSEDASLFVLALGRQPPPFAAKRFPLRDLTFPFVFELTSDDLLPPQTPETFKTSSTIQDTITFTTLITPSRYLSNPTGHERFAFGMTDPKVFAGKIIRSRADLHVPIRLEKNDYKQSDLQLLATFDQALEKLEDSRGSGGGGATQAKKP
eukprot:gene9196-10156_t